MSKLGEFLRKFKRKQRTDVERGARRAFMEDLFYDLNRSRAQIYKLNFFRGIFFGLGSVLGGTVVVAIVLWILHFFVDFPGIGHTIEGLRQTINGGK